MAEIVLPEKTPNCPACGTTVGGGDQFCKRCGNRVSSPHSDIGSSNRKPSSWETNKKTNPWPIVLVVVGVLFIMGIIGTALTSDSEENDKATPTPTATPDWRTFMDDRDVTLLSSGIVRLGRRYDVRLDEHKVRRFFAQNMTDELAEESGWEKFWLWIITVIGDYDEQDVANELEDSIYDDGDDVREFLESFKLCCAASP